MDDLTALRELGQHLAPDDLAPPAGLRSRVLATAANPPARRRAGWRPSRPLVLIVAAAATVAVAAGSVVAARSAHPTLPPATSPHPAPSPDPATSTPARQCNDKQVTVNQLPELLYLPAESLTGPMQSKPQLVEAGAACSYRSTSAGVWYARGADGRVSRKFTVQNTDQTNPGAAFTHAGGARGQTQSSVTVDGRPGAVYLLGKSVFVYWTAVDGSRWEATGAGMSQEQTMAAVRATAIKAGKVDPAVVPAGLEHGLTGPAMPPAVQAAYDNLAFADFEFHGPGRKSIILSLTVTPSGPAPLGADPGTRPVDVNGTTGWISAPSKVNGEVTLAYSPAAGVCALLTLTGTEDQALALARSTTKVSPSTPRLHDFLD